MTLLRTLLIPTVAIASLIATSETARLRTAATEAPRYALPESASMSTAGATFTTSFSGDIRRSDRRVTHSARTQQRRTACANTSRDTAGAKQEFVVNAGDPSPSKGFVLTSEERAWLADLPALRVAIDSTAEPLSFVDRDGNAVGLALDYLEEALDMLGVRSVPVATVDWPDTVALASAGAVDLLAAASPRHVELGQRFAFTAPYVEFPIMIVTQDGGAVVKGPADLGGQRVAANLSLGSIAAAVRDLPVAELVGIRTATEGLEAVASGRADAYIGDIATADYLIRRDHAARLKVAAPTDERARLAIAVDRRYAPLVPLLDRALASIGERRAQSIRNTWLRSEYTWGGSWSEVARKAGPAGLVALLLLLAVTHAYVRLRRETRRRLNSEEQLADITSHLPAVFYRFRYHATGEIEFIHVGGNPGPIFGVAVETLLRDERRAFAHIDPRDQAPLLAEVARSASTLTPLHAEMRIRDAVPERWVASHALPRPLPDAVEFTGYWIDVSERREQAAQLAAAKRAAEAATEAKSQFLATMSHEIRTPMHGVLGMLEMLGETPLDPAQRRLLSTAEASAEALLQILGDVLDLSRIEAGKLDIERAPFDLRQLVRGVADLFARQAQQKGLLIEIRFDDDLGRHYLGDAARLRQVLLNLVSNAVKFTTQGAVSIHVGVDATDTDVPQIRIEIRDTGEGVSPDDIERLFAPFSQAEASTTRRFGGSGLGLAICRRLMVLLGGDVVMTGEPGRGTCVAVTLPLEAHAPEAPLESVAPEPDASEPFAPLNVLIAEDNAINRELVAVQLARLGQHYSVACDGNEALTLASSQAFDVLLTDLHMPSMDGYELTRALRDRGMPIRIAAMTANAMPGERERCLDAGMDGFLIKPVRLAALRQWLLSAAHDGPPAPWNVLSWRDTYGDLALLPAMVARFESSLREDLALIEKGGSPAQLAESVHRLLGGMRVFGPSPEAMYIEQVEHALRGPKGEEAVRHIPVLVRRAMAYRERLHAALSRS